MSVTCQMVMDVLDNLAPRWLAEPWDNVGLLVGDPQQDVSRIFLALSVTPEIIQTVVEKQVDLLITHHPLIFKPLTNLRTDGPPGNMLVALLKADISLFTAHTNLDSATGGVNDVLAGKIGLQQCRPLTVNCQEGLLKLVVFVPREYVQSVREAVSAAGAGCIGGYSHCSFQTEGTGTFFPLPGAQPFIGQAGQLEIVDEVRLETILPAKLRKQVVDAMLAAHPYEEVAYDLIRLENSINHQGLGRVGILSQATTLGLLAAEVKTLLGVGYVQVVGEAEQQVKKVAVCGGAGGSLIEEAVKAGADVFITGDVKYHEALLAREMGLALIDAGHFSTEQLVLTTVAAYLQDWAHQNNWQVSIQVDSVSKDVFSLY